MDIAGPYDLPLRMYPFRIEALHPDTRMVLWTRTVQAPMGGKRDTIHIPALRERFGHPVQIRMVFADGTVEEGRLH
jgi:hypothetical protein